MPLPVLARGPYSFATNIILKSTGTAGSDHQRLIRRIKTELVAFGKGWTVRRSSDGAGNVADSDLWASDTNLVWAVAGSNHSWIVIYNTNIGANFEVCIDLNSATLGNGTVAVSHAGFTLTAGTATARPTASDEQVIVSAAALHALGSSTFDVILNLMMSTDGTITRIFGFSAYATKFFASFENPSNAVTGWTTTGMGLWLATAPAYSALNGASAVAAYKGFHSGAMPMYLSGISLVDGVAGNKGAQENNVVGAGEMSLLAIGLVSETTGKKGRHGTIADMYWGGSARVNGVVYPVDTRLWIQVGCLVVPWDGSLPVIRML